MAPDFHLVWPAVGGGPHLGGADHTGPHFFLGRTTPDHTFWGADHTAPHEKKWQTTLFFGGGPFGPQKKILADHTTLRIKKIRAFFRILEFLVRENAHVLSCP